MATLETLNKNISTYQKKLDEAKKLSTYYKKALDAANDVLSMDSRSGRRSRALWYINNTDYGQYVLCGVYTLCSTYGGSKSDMEYARDRIATKQGDWGAAGWQTKLNNTIAERDALLQSQATVVEDVDDVLNGGSGTVDPQKTITMDNTGTKTAGIADFGKYTPYVIGGIGLIIIGAMIFKRRK